MATKYAFISIDNFDIYFSSKVNCISVIITPVSLYHNIEANEYITRQVQSSVILDQFLQHNFDFLSSLCKTFTMILANSLSKLGETWGSNGLQDTDVQKIIVSKLLSHSIFLTVQSYRPNIPCKWLSTFSLFVMPFRAFIKVYVYCKVLIRFWV